MNENTLYDLADLFKVFGDSTRLRILCVLIEQEEICVADLADTLEMTQSAISHQLRSVPSSKRAESTLRRRVK